MSDRLRLLSKHHDRADFDSVHDWWRHEMSRRIERLELIDKLPRDKSEEFLALDREMCARDFVHWARNYAWILDPHAKKSFLREIPYHPWPKQIELCFWLDERVENCEPALINKGRSLGISWTCLLKCYHRWKFEWYFGAKIGSRKEKLVDDGTQDSLFGKLRHLHKRQPPHLRNKTKDKNLQLINTENGSELVGEATNEGFARGARRTIAVIDEFAHIHPSMQAKISLAIETVAVSLWMPSTPNGKANKFFDLYEHLPKRQIFEMTWKDRPDRPADFKEKMTRPIGRLTEAEFAQEHEADFSAVLTGRIWTWDQTLAYNESLWRDEHMRASRLVWPVVGGWDFGSGPSLLCCMVAVVDASGSEPIVYVDDERTWQQSDWKQAAFDTKEMMKQYMGPRLHFGDPAGRQKDSSQRSWEMNLRGGGVPLVCLDDEYGTQKANEWMIKEVQSFIDEDRIFIHKRCKYLLNCIQNWKRNAPDGVELDFISSTYIPPRKDVFSHGSNALMYLIAGVILTAKQMKQETVVGEFEPSKSSEIQKVLAGR